MTGVAADENPPPRPRDATVTLTIGGAGVTLGLCSMIAAAIAFAYPIGQKGRKMRTFLTKIPYAILIVFAILMLLAPFRPMPHVVEKLIMLKNGSLQRPIDIFDLFYHTAPLILLILKIALDTRRPKVWRGRN